VDIMEDLSGLEPTDTQWISTDSLPDTLVAILAEVGRVYAPFLLANAAALASGAEHVDCTIDGRRWLQRPFPYQAKCLQALRERYASLAAHERRILDAMLAGTGCGRLFAG
jgi:hypothetical protein